MASGGPPPAFGFRPPAPNAGGQFRPPPPPGQASPYESEGEDDGGALTSTINLVTSAANMFFKPPPPPNDNGPPPPPPQGMPPRHHPPAPIEATTSMLDTPASAFQQAPPAPAIMGTPQTKMTIGGNAQMAPPIPSLLSQPATPTQFPPPRPATTASSSSMCRGFPPPQIPATPVAENVLPPPTPPAASSFPPPAVGQSPASPVANNVFQAPPPAGQPPASPAANNTQQPQFPGNNKPPASPVAGGFAPPSSPSPAGNTFRATVNAVAAANKFMSMGEQPPPSPKPAVAFPPPAVGQPPASPAANNVFQAPPPAAVGHPTPASPAAKNTQQPQLQGFKPPASPVAGGFGPPSSPSPAGNTFRATVNAVSAANKFMSMGARSSGEQPPSPKPSLDNSPSAKLRGAVNAAAVANNFMKLVAKDAKPDGEQVSVAKQPSPKPSSPSKLRGAVNAAAVANNFMKLVAKDPKPEQVNAAKQPSPKPSSPNKLRGAVNAAAVANNFMKLVAKDPKPDEGQPQNDGVQQLRGAVTTVMASNMLKGPEVQQEPPSGKQLLKGAVTTVMASNILKGPEVEQEPPSGKQLLKGAVTTVMASNTLGGSSPARPPMQKFTPPPSPKIPAISTRSPRTPLIANTSPTAAIHSSSSSSQTRTPVRKLNLPTPSPRARTTTPTHRQLRLPPAKSSSGSGSTLLTKTTPRSKFRLPPSRKKKATTTEEPMVNLKPKVGEAPPSMEEFPAPTTTVPPTTTAPKMEKPVETAPAELHPTATAAVAEEPKEPEVSEPPKAAEDALPEGWIATTDPTLGKVYYYNAETQETSWEKPKATPPAINDDKVVEETTPEPAVNELAIPTPATDALPVGWIETTDPTSGKVYYYNADTQETSWEKPKVETAPATDNTIEVLSQLKNKSSIGVTDIAASLSVEEEPKEEELATEEWSEVTDPTSGKLYYYNTVTQESSWDRPAAMDQPAKESAPEAEETKEAATEDSIFAELNAEFGYVDPSENNEEEDATPTPAAGDVPEEEDTTPTAEDVPEERDALPVGWTEVVDPTSGNTYYYNPTTQETSWELPVSESVEKTEATKVDAAPSTDTTMEVLSAMSQQPEETTSASEEQSPEKGTDLAVDWEEVVDPNSGDVYYFNSVTNETSWERPTVEASSEYNIDEEPVGSKELGAEETSGPPVEETPEETSDMPADWEEVVDPNSGDVYYFNAVTNETSWERPSAEPVNDDTDKEPGASEEVQLEELSPAVEVTQEKANDLPADWEEVVDPNSGDVYYFNPVTNETSWERPGSEEIIGAKEEAEPAVSKEIQIEESTPAVEISPEKSSDLPADWEEVVDPNSGDVYFFNPVTNETSWERPGSEETTGAKEEEAEPAVSKEIETEESTPVEEELSEKSSDLPLDWEEVVDPNSGDVYYFNPVTNETSWERPGSEETTGAKEEAEESAVSKEIQTEESTPAVEEPSEKSNDLPADWEKVVDPNSGDGYYFNSATNETSWERPGSEGADEAKEEVEPTPSEEPVPSEEIEAEEPSPAEAEMEEEENDLPADWEKVVDPNSGDGYYFNSVTNETSWERPGSEGADEAKEEVEPTPSEEPVPSEEIEAEEPSPAEAEMEEEENDLPADWEKVVDPNSGDVYYFNSVTNETSWERPGSEEANEAPAAEVEPPASEEIETEEPSLAVEETQGVASDLPVDWEEVVDPNSGDVYYFNAVTNETSWERPTAEPANDNSDKELAASGEVQVEDSNLMVEETQEEENDLPANWEEVVDPNNGDVYYFNSVTNETSWERPSAEGEIAELEQAALEEIQAEESSSALEEPSEKSNDLPADWEEVVDPNSGGVYFFNSVTNETSWERPGSEAANEVVAEADPAASEEIQEEEPSPTVEETQEEANDLPADWEEVVDPNSGDVYYFNPVTNETSWERPGSVEANEEAKEEVEPATSEQIEKEESTPAVEEPEDTAADAESSDLPENWTEVVDESTGQTYFFNSLTQETSWERPVKEEAVVEEQDEVPEDVAPEENIDSADNTGAEPDTFQESQLPADWIEAVDETSGQKYYYNTVSQETSWEKPLVADNELVGVAQEHVESVAHQEDAVVDDTAPETDGILPPNWIETEDESGQLYYYNTVTSETAWDRPSMEIIEEDGAENSEPEVVEPVSSAAKGDESDSAVHENSAEDQTDLPADWIEAVDETSGQTYYYNTATQETSWEKPSPVADDQEDYFGQADEAEDDAPEDDQKETVVDDSPPDAEDELPRDWIEAVDESSGQTYYYNTVTEETSWEKPSNSLLEEESESVEQVTEKAVDSVEETAATSEPANDATESTDVTDHGDDKDGSKFVLPEYWTCAVDETTGETYYFNSLTQETSWVLPEGSKEREVEPSEEPGAAESVPPEEEDESLPENWSKEVDETTGEVYYYNSVTHESAWDRPGTETDTDADPEDSGSETEHSEHEETEHSEHEETEHSEHEETEHSEHETDSQDEDDEDEDYVGDRTDNDIDDTAPTNTEVEDELEESPNLPANWIESVDESSGQTYYYNTETQETTWERPDSAAQEDENDIPSTTETPSAGMKDDVHDEKGNDPSPAKNELEITPREDAGPASEWAEVLDETSGQVYYYNSVTQETSWEKPSALSENVTSDADENAIIPSVDSATEETSVNDQEPELEVTGAVEGSDLPENWIEAVDEDSGQIYYYNTVTQETSWEKPSSAPKDDTPDVSDGIGAAADNDEVGEEEVDAEGEGNNAQKEPGGLPSEWIEAVDESSGQTYYYNTVTEETSWEKPSEIAAQNEEALHDNDEHIGVDELVDHADPAEDNMETDNDVLPSGWVEAVDENNGQTYYYNTVTQETSWEKPSQETPADDAVDVNVDTQDAGIDVNGESTDGNADLPSTEFGEGEAMQPEEELPSEWVETVDESTGQVYYFNTATQETSWEKPSISSKEKSEAMGDDEPEVAVDEIIGEDGDEANDVAPVEENEKIGDDTLPSEWIEAVDESSGKVYYYNTETQETSWEKPKSKPDETPGEEDSVEIVENEPVSEHRTRDDTIDEDIKDVAIGNSLDVSQDSLPSGWVEVVDEDSGNVYYYNSETDESSWEKPSAKSSEPITVAPNELEDDNAEDEANEEWEIVDGPKDDVVLVDGSRDTDVDMATHIANICDERQDVGILGPLSLSEDEAVLSYIESKSKNTQSPLWGLIDIAARSRGRLRSEDGVADRSSPESLIVELLLREESGNTPAIAPSKQFPSTTPVEEDEDLRMERVQSLLLRGNRVEAVKEAVECKDFATALLVASMCDPETYKFAAKSYAENVFAGGSPMYTIGMLFSGSMQVPPESSPGSFWGIGSDELNGTWKKHLAAVISNRTAGWDRVVLSLGDRLREIGSIEGAHFCYMVCGCRFTDPLDVSTRVSLLGCDHADDSIIGLMTNGALDSFVRTEAYEWAKRRGNKNATIKSFQPFKVIFATSLVDYGFEEQATLYALGIRHCTDVASARAIDLAGPQWSQVFEDSEAMAGAFRALEERLDLAHDEDEGDAEYEKVEDEGPATFEEDVPVATNPNDSYAEEDRDAINSTLNLTDNDATFVTAASNLMDKPGFSVTPQRETSPEPTAVGGNVTTKAMPVPELDSMGPPGVATMPTIVPPVAPSNGKVPKSDTPTMPPRMPPTPTMRNNTSNKEEASTPMQAGPPAAAPVAALTPKETIKQPDKAPSTAPSIMMGKKSEPRSGRKAPSSTEKPRSGGLLSGFRSRMIKVFNKDAVECNLPDDEEKAYYDEKLKRWVFPGDDLDELAKPMAPPPIIPGGGGGGDSKPAAEPEPKPDVNDPLAAMMAPPSRRPAALRRPGGTPTMPPVGGAMPPMPGMPPMMMPGMPSPVAGGAAAPPQFAVFTPKKEEEQKKDEE